MKKIGALSFVEKVFDGGQFFYHFFSGLIFCFDQVSEVRSVFIPNAVELEEVRAYHEDKTTKHLRCKGESLEGEPELNIGAIVKRFVQVSHQVWNIQDWTESKWIDYNLDYSWDSLRTIQLKVRCRQLQNSRSKMKPSIDQKEWVHSLFINIKLWWVRIRCRSHQPMSSKHCQMIDDVSLAYLQAF